jgi:nucleotide-binding universal stress UspA family protein
VFKNILVPLDGSKLAETALPYAISFSRNFSAPVMLLHIIEKDAPQEVHKDHHLTKSDEAEQYLNSIAKKAFPEDVKVETHVHAAEVKDVAASIIQHATEEFKPDLIVLCAHGQSGFRDLIFGNIAQQVLAGGQIPLLLIQSRVAESRPFSPRRIFVPLDSESVHDDSLPFAELLAKAYDAEIYLLTVIPTYGTLSGEKAAVSSLLPVTSAAILDIQEEAMKEHLQTHLDDLLNRGFNATAEIARGDPATLISETAGRVGADLILLSTHRRAGMGAFWARSVAPNVVRKTRIPVFLIPHTDRN